MQKCKLEPHNVPKSTNDIESYLIREVWNVHIHWNAECNCIVTLKFKPLINVLKIERYITMTWKLIKTMLSW